MRQHPFLDVDYGPDRGPNRCSFDPLAVDCSDLVCGALFDAKDTGYSSRTRLQAAGPRARFGKISSSAEICNRSRSFNTLDMRESRLPFGTSLTRRMCPIVAPSPPARHNSLDGITTGTKLWLPEAIAARDPGGFRASAVHTVDQIADV